MAAEEFQESDVIFSDHDHDDSYFFRCKDLDHDNSRVICNNSNRRGKKKNQQKSSSVPVNIPSNVFRFSDAGDFDEEYDGDELIPPHVILGRRIEGKMAFSVCTGNGRTLKGRDLSRVRNSVLRLTGFLET
ncbi:hypothetical protein JCGZ_21644 [Jatropha curcas]|uniref:Senescence regulator n=1 Tax=Jatropha curcas TaxID=180498 RepID=A0A067JEH9_JATCU|nr:uncharacterized protein LOC105649734 [Jatropha curcas]KDP21173.1 hypothetical protein JCGZ_21644 [Jatropha curcas]